MDIYDPLLEIKFPKIKDTGYKVISPATKKYNCIGWSLGLIDYWVWPNDRSFWPEDLIRDNKLSIFVKLYQELEYVICDNDRLEVDYEKIAIYIMPGTNIVTHAARQLETGKWTSKIGEYKDIEHNTLDCLTGSVYGMVSTVMKRKRGTTINVRTTTNSYQT